MTPEDILRLRQFPSSAKVLYAAMALQSYKSGYVTDASHARLADISGLSRPTVIKAIKFLQTRKLIEVAQRNGQVTCYRLLHDRWKQAKPPIAAPPTNAPVTRGVVLCCKCPNRMRRAHRSGICKDCRDEIKMERTARRVFHEEAQRLRREKATA